ncbi:MAG: hypothetical protein WC956_02920 [bacterium]
MKDTPETIERMVIERMKILTGEERLRMGASMFDAAKRLVLASMAQCDRAEVRRRMFLRFYGNEFSGEKREKILRRLAQTS